MAMAIVALAAIQTGKLCLLATFPANPVSIVRRFYTLGTLPKERRTNHKRSSFLCNKLVLLCFVLLSMRGGLMSIVRIAALILIAGTIAAQQPPAQPAQPAEPLAPVAAVLENYKPVTAERLKKPEDGDWLMVRRTYDGWGYSPLEQVTTKNVQRLFPVWEFSTGMVSGHEAPPIVNNGVMFVATPGNQVIAIEAKTGKPLWRFRRPFADGAIVPHPTTRGLALYANKLFFAVGEAG